MQGTSLTIAPAEASWLSIHPLSQEDSAAVTTLRSMVAGVKGKLQGTNARNPFNSYMERVEAPEGVVFEVDTIGEIPGWWAKPAQAWKGTAIIHMHGGLFNLGTAQAYRKFLRHIALSG